VGLEIAIAGTTRTTSCDIKSLLITNTITSNASVMELAARSSGDWRPRAGNQITVSTTSDSVRYFGGVVARVSEEARSRREFYYRMAVNDWTILFDRRLVAANYGSSAASAIVADIVTSNTTGFSTAPIDVAPSVSAKRWDYVKPSEAIQQLADELQWHWFINSTQGVEFFTALSDVAPSTAINFDSSTGYSDLVLEERVDQVKNRIILQGYKRAATVQIASRFQADGQQRFFYGGYEPVDTASANITATLDGASLAIGTDEIDAAPGTTQGTSSTVYVCFANMGFRFSSGFSAPSSSMVFVATYTYLREGGIQYDDPTAQTDMASRSSGDGVHMFMVNDPGLTNNAANDDLALGVGAALTDRYGAPGMEGTFRTYGASSWRAGQYFTGSSTYRLGGFERTFYIHQVQQRVISHPDGGSPTWQYDISISDSAITR
jgi:hypothetical protein